MRRAVYVRRRPLLIRELTPAYASDGVAISVGVRGHRDMVLRLDWVEW
jgi:hypothetical protein